MDFREKIIEVALDLFLKNGIKKITVRRLIHPLGISSKTFYRYFEDKESLLRICLERHYAALSNDLVQAKDKKNDPIWDLCLILNKLFKLDFGISQDFYADLNYFYPELQEEVVRTYAQESLIHFRGLIVAGMKMELIKPTLNPDLVVETIGILYMTITRTNRLKGVAFAPIDVFNNTINVYIQGICTDQGLVEFESFYEQYDK